MTLPRTPFSDAIEDVSRGNPRLPQSEFGVSGTLPVVDQGKELIAGYTEDQSLRCKIEPPVIVFGDHTRVFKYIDFPFVIGADGVKVLRARDGWDSKYVYHYLRAREVPSAGYSRHFKFLRELDVPKPSLEEQRRIAAILDQADALRAKRRQVLAHLDTLTQSIFHEMFGFEEWAWTLGDLADVQIGPFGSLLHQADYVAGGVAVINPMHIRYGTLHPDPEFSVSEQKASKLSLYRLRRGDVVLGRRGEMGRAGVAAEEHAGLLCGTGSLILRPNGVDSRFLHAVVTSSRMKGHLERSSRGATLPNLNAGIVKSAPAPKAPADVQTEFAARVAHVEQAAAITREVAETDSALFASLQSRAFRGEL